MWQLPKNKTKQQPTKCERKRTVEMTIEFPWSISINSVSLYFSSLGALKQNIFFPFGQSKGSFLLGRSVFASGQDFAAGCVGVTTRPSHSSTKTSAERQGAARSDALAAFRITLVRRFVAQQGISQSAAQKGVVTAETQRSNKGDCGVASRWAGSGWVRSVCVCVCV